MKTYLQFLFVLSVAFITTGCVSFSGIKGSGVAKTENRYLPPFTSIQHSAIGNVAVTIGETQSVSVTLDDNLMEHLDLRVIDGELRIKTMVNFNSRIGPKIKITVPAVERLELRGVGKLKISGIDSDELAVAVSGVGSIDADGKVKNLNVTLSGVGNANMESLKAEAAVVNVSGVGSARVFASESVDANASGVGGIKVLGIPKDHKETATGIGKVTYVK